MMLNASLIVSSNSIGSGQSFEEAAHLNNSDTDENYAAGSTMTKKGLKALHAIVALEKLDGRRDYYVAVNLA